MPSPKQRQQFFELTDWLKAKGESQRAFASRVQMDKSVFSKVILGKLKRTPLELIAKISAGTEKEIGLPEFVAFAERLEAARKSPRRKAA